MTRCRALAITACVLAAHGCLMPRVVQWNIGQNIRESTERHVGINPGEAYLVGDGEGRPTIAQELTYERDTPLISFLGEAPLAQNIRMGEHYREVTIRRSKLRGIQSTVGERYAPNGQPMERCNRSWSGSVYLTPSSMGSADVQYSRSHRLATLAAVPFDCFIDPVLSVPSSAVALPLIWYAALGGYLYFSLQTFY